MFKSLDHIAISISKEDSLKFYEKLGFSEIKRNYREGKDTIVFMKGYGIVLEMFIGNHSKVENDYYGLKHLAFVVDSIEDTIKEYNLGNLDIKNFGENRYAFFFDPDGLEIELQEKHGENEC